MNLFEHYIEMCEALEAELFPLTSADLDRYGANNVPPQSWYDEDFSGLFSERVDVGTPDRT